MPEAKLTPAQAGKLGGLRRAETLTPDEIQRIGQDGGRTTVERYGRSHMTKLAHKRWGRLNEKPAARTTGTGEDR